MVIYVLFLFMSISQGLVLLYMEKVQKHFDTKSSGISNSKEEVFRCILTLHSLLENPPGDFPDDLREDIVNGFIGIFTKIRYICGHLSTRCSFLFSVADLFSKDGSFCLISILLASEMREKSHAS